MRGKYKISDPDIDSLETYLDNKGSQNCLSFLARRWKTIEALKSGIRKSILIEDWNQALRAFYYYNSAK